MKGLDHKHEHLGSLMRSLREKKGLSLESAASILGYHDRKHMSLAECGRIGFTARKLARAIKLYGVKPESIIKAAVKDFEESLTCAIGSL